MSTTTTKRKPTTGQRLTVDEMIAKEVAVLDRYIMETAKEMSRPKEPRKTPKSLK